LPTTGSHDGPLETTKITLYNKVLIVSATVVTVQLHKLSRNRILQVVVIWVVMPCNDVTGYQYFGRSYFLHLQNEVNGSLKWT
jgi:hypothetical protein